MRCFRKEANWMADIGLPLGKSEKERGIATTTSLRVVPASLLVASYRPPFCRLPESGRGRGASHVAAVNHRSESAHRKMGWCSNGLRSAAYRATALASAPRPQSRALALRRIGSCRAGLLLRGS